MPLRFSHTRLLLLLCLTAGLLQAALEFEKTRLDLKAEAGVKTLDLAYAFTNTGKEAVKVIDITTSCGCTVPELLKRDYAPGEKGLLKARFDIGDRQGLQSKTIMVRTDAGDQSLQLVVDIPQRLVITPRLIVFRPTDLAERKVTLTFRSDTPITRISVGDVTPPFSVVLNSEKSGYDYTLSVGLSRQPEVDLRATVFVRSLSASGLEYTDALFLRYVP